ncbi:NAD(P)H nitroreductase [Mycolicibacterium sp. BiH015]|uniref:Acg family FMN-binding oxidoreductase n=1 Tax=Mycolicibacterium sp. BiH015 TaxID=3018808 RepID=UPI0022E07349|nr:NAD(P)H nitroreductase [Mycolicibacterium sp. BiH015]MDA2891145.1 NAD(P)H nitroreductase [Mycolicibacterium sp. BiH015]
MPATRVPTETIMDALEVACRAPSLHNSQPWRWVATDRGVDLFADPRRMIRAADSSGREALISCGAVLDHFRVAMAAAGWDTVVRRLPDPADPLHIAGVDLTAAPQPTAQQRARADAILLRRTDRLPMSAPQDWHRLAAALGGTARRATVRADALADDARESLAEACHLAEAIRMYDSHYHSELFWWTADFVADDGIPRSALISAAESDRVNVGRSFPVTAHPERHDDVDDDRAGILVLSTEDDSRESVLRCGEALSAVLLDATMAGMATCTVTHVTEVPDGRDIVASLVGITAIPQAIVRVGVAPALAAPPPPTPRRPIREIFEIHRAATC